MNSVGERDSTSGSSASIAVSWFHIRKCMSLDFRRQRPHLYALPIASGKARSLRTMSLRPLCTIADSPDPRDFAWRMHLSPFLFLTHGSAETLPLSLHPQRLQNGGGRVEGGNGIANCRTRMRKSTTLEEGSTSSTKFTTWLQPILLLPP